MYKIEKKSSKNISDIMIFDVNLVEKILVDNLNGKLHFNMIKIKLQYSQECIL